MKYNPFKMWGSWAGAFVGFMYFIFLKYNDYWKFITQDLCNIYETMCYIELNTINIFLITLIGIGVYFIVGFLVGWIIHSLVKKCRKEGKAETEDKK